MRKNLEELVSGRRTDPLGWLPPKTARSLWELGVRRTWNDGEVVLCNGSVALAAVLVLKGRLRVSASTAGGTEVLFRWFLPGEFVGLASILGEAPSPVDVIAGRGCQSLNFERTRFLHFLETDPEAALAIARVLGRFVCDINRLFVAQTAESLSERVLRVLLRLASREPAQQVRGEVELRVSQQELANAVGVSRQHVNRALHRLESAGRVRLGYRRMAIVLHSNGHPTFHGDAVLPDSRGLPQTSPPSK